MFITIEGIDYSGKSTICQMLADESALGRYLEPSSFRDRILQAVFTREPGGSPTAELIREILKTAPLPDEGTRLLLNLAARSCHLAEVIRPAIAEGKIVICDRYFDSTMVYQGFVGGVDPRIISGLSLQFCEGDGLFGYMPERTIWIDTPPDVAYNRMVEAKEGEVFGVEEGEARRDRLHALAQGFRKQHTLNPDRIVRIDGDRPINSVFIDVVHSILGAI